MKLNDDDGWLLATLSFFIVGAVVAMFIGWIYL